MRVRASSKDLNIVEMPKQWYNLVADLPLKPPPALHPKTHKPLKFEDLSPLFPDELIKQEVSHDRFIDIPDEVIDIYKLWRPTPLIRAKRLEKLINTPARIYYKYEGTSPAGSHKPNTAVPQAWYNAQQGVRNVVTETGAGQWGSALAFACSLFGLNCGLRYHGMAPLISHVYELGFMEAAAVPQTECFQAALQFARTEGLIPAPEPTHAIAAAIREALHCKETGERKVILMAMCGHGHFDLTAYEKYLQGDMVDLSYSREKVQESLAAVPQLIP
ncbi:hypothetical protein COCNU_01G005890 [Cocos nucifera]|uniref:tryptophan synthase n=1 Tax=Cocos nucifera TaxID=13894 RepID=A0A8K0HU67_COCNU|nr:hypothetical protein COCNU_01G005890 [Cocos nucifera]